MRVRVAPAVAGERLDVALRRALEGTGIAITRSRLARAFADAAVRGVDGPLKASLRLDADLHVELELPEPQPLDAVAEPIPLVVAYEDDDVLVVDKPAGMPVHPGPGHARGTLVNAVLAHLGPAARLPILPGNDALRPGIVHRIDRDTSGLVVVTKSLHAQEVLADQFRRHSIGRSYVAVVAGVPRWTQIHVDTGHGRDPHDRRRFAPLPDSRRRAVSDAGVLEGLHEAAVCRWKLHTGRTHQIRMHARHLGHPLVGDALYGSIPRSGVIAAWYGRVHRHALHAELLRFAHPDGRLIELRSALPAELVELCALLRA